MHSDYFRGMRNISHVDVWELPAGAVEVVEREGPPIEEYEHRTVSSPYLILRSSSPEFPNRDGDYLIVERTLVLSVFTTGWQDHWVIAERRSTYPCDSEGNPLDLADDYEVSDPPEQWEPERRSTTQSESSELLSRQPLVSLMDLRIDDLTVLQIATDILSVILPDCADPDARYFQWRYEHLLTTGLSEESTIPFDIAHVEGPWEFPMYELMDAFQVDENRVVIIWLPRREPSHLGLVVTEFARVQSPDDDEVHWRYTDHVEVYGCFDARERDDELWFAGRADLEKSQIRLGFGFGY